MIYDFWIITRLQNLYLNENSIKHLNLAKYVKYVSHCKRSYPPVTSIRRVRVSAV